jgi:hypothetical protein
MHLSTHGISVDAVPSAANNASQFQSNWAPATVIDPLAPWVASATVSRVILTDTGGLASFGLESNTGPRIVFNAAWSAGDGALNQLTLLELTDGSGTVASVGPVTWDTGTSHVIAVLFDGNNASVTIDGVEQIAPTAVDSTSLPAAVALSIEGSAGGDTTRVTRVSVSQ